MSTAHRRLWPALLAMLPAALLVGNLAVLVALRHTVLGEGVPDHLDFMAGRVSDAAAAYGFLGSRGLIYVPNLTAALIVLGALARKSSGSIIRRVGLMWIVVAVALLALTVWAGAVWWGFGW